eukprot:TRINITY_DN59463_c0_g1_i2.p1 TRINITY_DN59463_c0_g1~~TRINITY_DN59463_c0_g1_i2.p1  ORF type:complete len:108 (-),score=4.99 TRINITY_DN59463_c0_g1_i2:28-351(-)
MSGVAICISNAGSQLCQTGEFSEQSHQSLLELLNTFLPFVKCCFPNSFWIFIPRQQMWLWWVTVQLQFLQLLQPGKHLDQPTAIGKLSRRCKSGIVGNGKSSSCCSV